MMIGIAATVVISIAVAVFMSMGKKQDSPSSIEIMETEVAAPEDLTDVGEDRAESVADEPAEAEPIEKQTVCHSNNVRASTKVCILLYRGIGI